MKKSRFVLLISLPLIWFFFRLMPAFTHPAACVTPNFIYAENFEQLHIWCFDPDSSVRFDDSSNFLYVLCLWLMIHFLQWSTMAAAITINAVSMLASVYLLHRTIDSRFWSVQLLLTGLLFMATPLWAGILGDDILFQGMLWLLAIHAFWKQRYIGLMFWTSVNIIARPDNLLFLLPLIIASYWDIRDVKERDRGKFIRRRIRRTVLFLLLPVVSFFIYRYWYFGQVMPYNWLHHSLDTDKRFGIFNYDAFTVAKHYLRFYTLPLAIGVLFYFLKSWKSLNYRYLAMALGFILIPVVYNSTYTQDENLAYRNFYPLYLGLITFSLLFIRNYRSVTQGLTTAIFVVFYGFPISLNYFENTLQSANNNEYYLANSLASINNGKAILYYDNHLNWLTEWKVTFASGKHTKDGHEMTQEELAASDADLIVTDNTEDILKLSNKYTVFSVPKNTRQYEKTAEPENSLDKFFYKYARRSPIGINQYFTVLVWKYGKNYEKISEELNKHGAQEIKQEAS